VKDAKRTPEDIIDDVLRRVIDAGGVIDRAMAQAIARAVRHEWGGETARICYIARRDDELRTQRNRAILRDYLAGERIALLSRRYGLSGRRIIQIVKSAGPDDHPATDAAAG